MSAPFPPKKDAPRSSRPTVPLRLALRVEGSLWVAYAALPGSMKDAQFLGSIQMALGQEPAAKQAFMDLMMHGLGTLIEGITGQRPDGFTIENAPEHEKAGRA